MRKSELLKLYENAYNKIQALSFELEQLREENLKQSERIEELLKENERLNERSVDFEKADGMPNIKSVKTDISPDTSYGAQSIGRIVISAAKHCNELTYIKDTADVKELINLILGRTEVAKAEILKIVSCEADESIKKDMIDREEKSAEDYFLNIRAQI